MKKLTLTISVIILLTSNIFGQETKKVNSKMVEFTSKTGVIIAL